jgi:transposase-like protein
MSKGKVYTREFKIEAVQLLSSGQSLAQVSKDLNVSEISLTKWRKQLKT